MKVVIADDYNELSSLTANLIASVIKENKKPILGLATGSSPLGTYRELIKMYNEKQLSFKDVVTVNLDEYQGLGLDNDQSYAYFMNENLFKHVDIDLKNTHLPNGTILDGEVACKEYNELLTKVGRQDVQLLGIGHDGHIGFNEPNEIFDRDVHCVLLTKETREANKRFFASIDEVPTHAYTMGIRNIFNAKKVVLIASGADKKEIVKKAFLGDITPEVPASILQLHPDFTLIITKEIACDFTK